jgi:hypothetical protein
MRTRWIVSAASCVVLLTAFLGGASRAPQAQPKEKPRQPPPDAAAEKKALDQMRGTYGAQYDQAKTPEQKAALAGKLVAAAKRARRGSAEQFVLAKVARDVAVQAGNADLLVQAVDALAETFEIDVPQMKADLLPKVAKAARQPAEKKALTLAAIVAAEQAVTRDDYPTAEKMLELAATAAREAKDPALGQQVASRREAVQELARVYAVVAKARAVLEKNPKDASANLAVGSFLCLWKGDWEAGLPMLASCSDPSLRTLAERELDVEDAPQARAALADAWWDFAMKSDGTSRKQLQVHAAHWYSQAVSGLPDGPAKSKAQKRLTDAEGLAASLPMANKSLGATISSSGAGGKPELGRKGRLARKARYECVLGMYLDVKVPLPYVNLSVPNGSNIVTEDILTLLRGRVDINKVLYAGVAHFEIPADGSYAFQHGFGKVLINRRDMGLGGAKGPLVLHKGVYEIHVEQPVARLKIASLKITNTKTGEPVPVFNYGGDVEKFLRQSVGPWKVTEVSGWEPKMLSAGR